MKMKIIMILVVAAITVAGCLARVKGQVLYDFLGAVNAANPDSALISDQAENLYGTTEAGGTGNCLGFGNGCGTVFEMSSNGAGGWTETVLYKFQNDGDGWYPKGLVFDQAGNLYGTTIGISAGVTYELTPNGSGGWNYSLLSSEDASNGPLTFDNAGNLYGAGYQGCCGDIYELSPDGHGGWSESVLYYFQGGSDGQGPFGPLAFDKAGVLYGATQYGGEDCEDVNGPGCGTVFGLSPNGGGQWNESVLYRFCPQSDCTDGAEPFAGLTLDNAGNVYGTTYIGGKDNLGTVFELSPNNGAWNESVLHDFEGVDDGAEPQAGVLFDRAGNLWGTTELGGSYGCSKVFVHGCGSVYRLTPLGNGSWKEAVTSIGHGRGGFEPNGLLIEGDVVYGTALFGGSACSDSKWGCGTVFEIQP